MKSYILIFFSCVALLSTFSVVAFSTGRFVRPALFRRSAALRNLQLVHNNVLVKIQPAKDTSVGGIIIPDTAKEKIHEGQAIAVGPGVYNSITGTLMKNMVAQTGDHVVYGKYDGVELNYEGKPHHIIKDDDILFLCKSLGGAEAIPTIDNVVCARDNILVEIVKDNEMSAGGVVVSTAAINSKKRADSGRVVKVGPGALTDDGQKLVPTSVKVGDLVKFREYSGTEVTFGGVKYVVIKDKDLVAKH
jgi:chaperonin GroES